MREKLNLRIYLCAPSELKEEVRRWERMFVADGVICTNRWSKQEQLDLKVFKDLENAGYAQQDLDDIDHAQMFVGINPLDWAYKGTGGRHVEFGYALGNNKPIVLYGDKTNVFHYHESVYIIDSPGDLVKQVRRIWANLQP